MAGKDGSLTVPLSDLEAAPSRPSGNAQGTLTVPLNQLQATEGDGTLTVPISELTSASTPGPGATPAAQPGVVHRFLKGASETIPSVVPETATQQAEETFFGPNLYPAVEFLRGATVGQGPALQNEYHKALQAKAEGRTIPMIVHAAASGVPWIGPLVGGIASDIERGNYAGAAGTAVGFGTQIAMAKLAFPGETAPGEPPAQSWVQRLVSRFGTESRIKANQQIQGTIGELSSEASPTGVSAPRQLATRAQRALVSGEATEAQQARAAELAQAQERATAERALQERQAARRVGEERDIQSLSKPYGGPATEQPYNVGQQIASAIRGTRVDLPKLVENVGYQLLDEEAMKAGVRPQLSETTLAAQKAVAPETLADALGASAVNPQAIDLGRSLLGATDLDTASRLTTARNALGQGMYGRDYGSLGPFEQSNVNALIKLKGGEFGFDTGMSFGEVRRVLSGVNRGIAKLRAQGADVAGSPTLRALQMYKTGLDSDLAKSLEGHPELQGLYSDMKAITTERKGFLTQSSFVKRLLQTDRPLPYEDIVKEITRPQEESNIRAMMSGTEPGPATKAGIARFAARDEVQNANKLMGMAGDAARQRIRQAAVTDILEEAHNPRTGYVDYGRALDHLANHPGYRSIFGKEFNGIQTQLRDAYTRQLTAQAAEDAQADALKRPPLPGTPAPAQAADNFGRFLKGMARDGNPKTTLNSVLTDPRFAERTDRLVGQNTTLRSLVGKALLDRIAEQNTRGGLLNPVSYASDFRAAEPQLRRFLTPDQIGPLTEMTDALQSIGMKLRAAGNERVAMTERVGPLRLWGLAPHVMEVLTGNPANELAIRPEQIMRLTRNPQLVEAFTRTATMTPRGMSPLHSIYVPAAAVAERRGRGVDLSKPVPVQMEQRPPFTPASAMSSPPPGVDAPTQ